MIEIKYQYYMRDYSIFSKEYITEAIKNSFDIGIGVGPVHHFYKFNGGNKNG